MAGTFFVLTIASVGAKVVVGAFDDRIVCDVAVADGDDDGAMVDKAVELAVKLAVKLAVELAVELGASKTAVISLLVPTTVLRGLPLTAFTTYWPADGNITEAVPYWLSSFILKFAIANPTSDEPCTNRRSKSKVMGSVAFRVQRTKEGRPTMVWD